MILDLHSVLEVNFDPPSLDRAAREIARIRSRLTDDPVVAEDDLLDAMLVVLTFRRLEKTKPGALEEIFEAWRAAAGVKAEGGR